MKAYARDRIISYIQQEQDFDRAIVFLTQAASQQDTLPIACITHSIRVGLHLQAQGWSHDVILAGFLHDAVEDTDATLDEIGVRFGDRVRMLVGSLTHDIRVQKQDRSLASIDRCKQLGQDALTIKAADLLDNLRSYLPEANRSRLPQLAKTLDYFLSASADELENDPLWQELKHIRQKVDRLITTVPDD